MIPHNRKRRTIRKNRQDTIKHPHSQPRHRQHYSPVNPLLSGGSPSDVFDGYDDESEEENVDAQKHNNADFCLGLGAREVGGVAVCAGGVGSADDAQD